MTPRMMDIFILKEFRKVSLLVAMFQILTEKKTILVSSAMLGNVLKANDVENKHLNPLNVQYLIGL